VASSQWPEPTIVVVVLPSVCRTRVSQCTVATIEFVLSIIIICTDPRFVEASDPQSSAIGKCKSLHHRSRSSYVLQLEPACRVRPHRLTALLITQLNRVRACTGCARVLSATKITAHSLAVLIPLQKPELQRPPRSGEGRATSDQQLQNERRGESTPRLRRRRRSSFAINLKWQRRSGCRIRRRSSPSRTT
jgi:hypothetical protein